MADTQFKALVVDDEPIVCKRVKLCLRDAGFDCHTASDGNEALALLEQNNYHAVIIDLKMPNKNGQALILELLEQSDRPIIVVLTAVDHPKITEDLILMGVDDVMIKPVKHEAFAAKVRGLVKLRLPQEPPARQVTAPLRTSAV